MRLAAAQFARINKLDSSMAMQYMVLCTMQKTIHFIVFNSDKIA